MWCEGSNLIIEVADGRWTLIGLGVIIVIFLYPIVADRMTPYASQAIVQALFVILCVQRLT